MNIDARGDICPVPVVKLRKALKELPAGETVSIEVDNEIAVQNIQKMCNDMGIGCAAETIATNHYRLVVTPESGVAKAATSTKPAPRVNAPADGSGDLVVVSSSVMGGGDDKLGAALMQSFLYALAESPPPRAMVFYNGGARLTADGSPALADLTRLADAGVQIYTCGACINFYGLPAEPSVGTVTNMYAIVELMRTAASIIRP